MNASSCEKCGQSLALADNLCRACGTPVPVAQRLAVLLPRAEALAESERFADAARALEPALALELPPLEAKALWRKKGVWLRKAAEVQPALLDGAETAFGEALRLDDNDDLSHQLWIDLLVQRGYADKAASWYQQRLQLNPEDAMAKRQTAVLRLALNFKAQPAPKRQADRSNEPKGALWRMIVPTPGKTWMMGLSGVFTFAMMIHAAAGGGGPVAAAAPALPVDPDMLAAAAGGGVDLSGLMKSFDDPWSWAIQTLISVAYVYWAYSRRKRA